MRTEAEIMADRTPASYSEAVAYKHPGNSLWLNRIPTLANMARDERSQQRASRADWIKSQHGRTAEALEYHSNIQAVLLAALKDMQNAHERELDLPWGTVANALKMVEG